MNKKLLPLAGILLMISSSLSAMAIPGLPGLPESANRMDIQQSRQEDEMDNALVEDIIYKGTPVKTSDLIAKATYVITTTMKDHEVLQIPTCTGTLIEKDVILTAGHCLHDGDGIEFYVKYFSAATGTHKKLKVIQAIRHPKYKLVNTAKIGATVDNDIALLQLEKPVPGAVLALLPKAGQTIAKGQKVIVAGFGKNGMTKSEDDLKKDPEFMALQAKAKNAAKMTDEQKQNLVIEMMNIYNDRPLLKTESRASLVKDHDGALLVMQLNGGQDICSGDSGGPSYVTNSAGRLVVLGVHSTGTDNECTAEAGFIFKQDRFHGTDTYVAYHLTWIKETIKALRSQSEL